MRTEEYTSTGGQGSVKKYKQRKWEKSQEKESHSLPVYNSSEEKEVNSLKCHIEDLIQKWAVSMDIFNEKVT